VSSGQSFSVHDSHHRVHTGAGAHLGPLKRGHQGLGEGQAAGFHHQAIQLVSPFQQTLHRRQERVLNRATEATVGQFHQPSLHLLLRTKPALAQQLAVNPHIAKLIDNHRQALAAVEQQMAQERGFAGAKKSSHHRDGKAGR